MDPVSKKGKEMTPRLLSTKQYSRFEMCKFNRSVSKKKHLLESMRKHGFIPAYPIHCVPAESKLLQIKAGHHRFECARELGIPVYFVVSSDEATIHELEKSTNHWQVKDYLESHIRCGLEDYKKVRDYHQETGIPLGLCIAMLGGDSAVSNNMIQKFKYGTFTLKGEDHAKQVKDLVLYCRDFGAHIDQYFVCAMSRCLRVADFSIEVFKTRVASNSGLLKKCRNLEQQMQLVEEVYNFKSTAKTRLPLCFLVEQAMKARSAVLK